MWPLSDKNLRKRVLDAECQHKSPKRSQDVGEDGLLQHPC